MDKRKWILIAAAATAVVVVTVLLFVFLRSPKTPDADIVGLCYRDQTTDANQAERAALEALLKEKGLQVVAVDADADQAKQLRQIGELAAQGCDSLIIEPVMSDAAAELLQALDATGLPAVLYNRQIDTALLSAYSKIAYIGTDSSAPGKLQAQMAQSLPNGGDINGDGVLSYMLLQGPEDHTQTAEHKQSLEQALAESSLELHCLTALYGDLTQENGKLLCSQAMSQFGPDIEVVFCCNDKMALGAVEAIADNGRTIGTDVYLYGVDGDTAAMQAVEGGNLSGTVYVDPVAYRTAIVNTAVNQIKGQQMEKLQIIPYSTVTAKTENQES